MTGSFNLKAASSMSSLLLLVACMALALLKVESRASCQDVSKSMTNCIPYLKGSVPTPSKNCCGGVKYIKSIAVTTPDRRTVCGCLKRMATNMGGAINKNNAARLPGQCGVSVSYPINPNVDCSRIR